jgi:acyl-CoA thioesterase-1
MVALAALVNLCCLGATMTASAAESMHIVALGDSLTAGFMLPESAAFPAQLETALKARGHDVRITNAGVSGDTTAAGLERFEWSVPEDTRAVILELGANDALRGLDPKAARANLETIIARLEARGIEVLLAGMAAPRGLGEEYVAAFDPIYPELAQKHDLILYPFFLDGVSERPEFNLPDGLHPNAKGVRVIVERILPKVEELIARARARQPATANSKS